MFPLLWSVVICTHILVTQSLAQAPNGKCYYQGTTKGTYNPTENGVPDFIGQCAPICRQVTPPTDKNSVTCEPVEIDNNISSYGPIATVTTYNQGELLVGQCVCVNPWVNFFADIFEDAVVDLGQWLEEYIEPIFHVLEEVVEDVVETVVAAALTVALPGVGEVADAALGAVMVSARVADYTEGAVGGLAKFTKSLGPMAKTLGKTPNGIENAYNQAKALPDHLIYPPFKMPDGVKQYKPPTSDEPPPPGHDNPPPHNDNPPPRGRPSEEPSRGPTQGPSREPTPTQRPSSQLPSSHPPSSHPPSSRRSSETKTSSAAHCNLRRGPGPNDCDQHLTSVQKWADKARKTTRIETMCDAAEYPQACAGYYSAGVAGYPGIETSVTCAKGFDVQAERKNKRWPAVKKWYNDHAPVWRQWIDPTQFHEVAGNWLPDCDADEWPPLALLPLEAREDGDKYPQRVRLIDAHQNRGAGKLWRGFCNKNDGGEGNGRPTEDWFDGQYFPNVDVNPRLCKSQSDVKRGTTTWSSTCNEGLWTRAVFDMKFQNWPNGVPGPANNWYLDENKCWPSTIAPDDAGFALNTDDKWYDDPQRHVQRAGNDRYSDKPTIAWFKEVDAQRAQRNLPPLPHDSDGNPTQARKFGKGGGWQRRLRNRQVLQVLDDGFAISDANSTRRLTSDEVRRDIEVERCSDNTCSEEQAKLIDKTYVIVPAPRQSLPLRHPRAVTATATALTQVMTLETRVQVRMTVSPNHPKPTGFARVQ